MAKAKKNPYSYSTGFVQDRNTLRAIAQIDEIIEKGGTLSQNEKWTKADGKWTVFILDWVATRLVVVTAPTINLFAAGAYGDVVEASAAGVGK